MRAPCSGRRRRCFPIMHAALHCSANGASCAGVPLAQVLCIGDETRDYAAARQAGLDFGAVAWGYADPEVLRACGPGLFFPSVSALIEQLARQ